MKYISFGCYDKGKFDGMTERECETPCSTNALNPTSIFTPAGTWLLEKRFRGTALNLHWKNGKVTRGQVVAP